MAALDPVLSQLAQEIRRMIRYYEDRYGTERKITQVITLGGGANMPGMSEYLTNALRLAVRTCDPWSNIATTKACSRRPKPTNRCSRPSWD